MRSPILVSALASIVLAVACDNPAEEQQKAKNAQIEANEKIAQAKREAERKIDNAQAEADEKLAKAQTEFTKVRDEYRLKMQSDLAAMDRKIEEFDAKRKKVTGKAKTEADTKLQEIRASRDALVTDLKSVDAATAATWEDTKKRIDKKWTEFKDLVDKA